MAREFILSKQLIKAIAWELFDIVCQDVRETREDEKLLRLMIRMRVVFWTGRKLPELTAEEKTKQMIKARIFF